jgi:pilus assembly protein Flp/PilA
MNEFLHRLRASQRTERGASAVEYGLLIAGIAGLIVLAVFAMGPIVKEVFSDTCDSVVAEAGTSMSATCDS